MTKYLLFSGKGGVGKTTMASAAAIHYAMQGKKTLIVTTDPASNLADVFEQEIGHKITPIKGILGLFAMEIDPDEATNDYKERIIGPFRGIMPDDVIASLEEQFNSPCTTEIASFDRFVDFMESDDSDVVIFDTAPTGHTIRLLELPVDWSKHIEESAKGSGQTCLGPVQAIQESKEKYDRATALLKNSDRTTFVFVMRPEELSLYETIRASKELETIGVTTGDIIINGILPEDVCELEFFRKKYEAQQRVIKRAQETIDMPEQYMLLRDNEVKGVAALRAVAEELYHGVKPSFAKASEAPDYIDYPKPSAGEIDSLWLPDKQSKALFFTGKGGVGKTTVSCVAALYVSQKEFKTLLVTTDPAAHVGEVLDIEVGSERTKITDNLDAVMINQVEATKQYKEKILDDARGKYSEDMLAAMEEELNSPCTEEMAAFEKFAQFIESEDYEVLVFDTAPTGHTLRLLDLPFDYAKQVEMMIDANECQDEKEATEDRFEGIIDMLRDPNRTVFNLVLYPESTPIMESYRAMLDLKEAGIETQLVIANMVLPKEVSTNSFFKSRRRMQLKYLTDIQERFSLPVMQIPLMQDEVKGIEALIALGALCLPLSV
ncbi:MAG: TRC40/GET3/ArsA family transport-energizing ATPase [Actinomycetota bacterium]